jgi:hypothetical protein
VECWRFSFRVALTFLISSTVPDIRIESRIPRVLPLTKSSVDRRLGELTVDPSVTIAPGFGWGAGYFWLPV